MKKAIVLAGFAVLAAAMGAFAGNLGEYPFDSDWMFATGERAGAEKAEYDHSGWAKVQLPHDWSIGGELDAKNPMGGQGGFFPAGVGWYCKSYFPPADLAGKRVFIRFDGVYMLSNVYVNGEKLGTHPYGYTPFVYDITDKLKMGDMNLIAVKADNSKQVNSRWYSGSGIYRHVWLEAKDPVHVQRDGVVIRTEKADKSGATVKVNVSVENQGGADAGNVEISTDIFEMEGKKTGKQVGGIAPQKGSFIGVIANIQQSVSIESPKLWSPQSPNRYLAITTVKRDGKTVDVVETPFGIRTVEISKEKGFVLNGERVLLYGGCVHHDNGGLGAAAFDRAEERRVEILKSAGFNAIRTSHNPPSPAFLEACDRLGMMVMDEAFDCWIDQKEKEDYHNYFREWGQSDMEAMVLRDRNHPSVVMWSIGNEIPDFGNAQGMRVGTMLIERAKTLDPTRPVTAGVTWWNGMGGQNRWVWNDADGLMAKLDVVGYNYQISRYNADHTRVPDRIIVSTESYPRDMYASWEWANNNTWILGDFVWTAMDYLGESGIGRVYPPGERSINHGLAQQYPYHGAYCGDIDITGFRKPVSYQRNITWDRGEKLYMSVTPPTKDGRPWVSSGWSATPSLASWSWRGNEGKSLEVVTFSRCESVKVYLNGKLVDEKPTTMREKFKATFNVPYESGELKAEGIIGGKVAETMTLKTAGPVAGIRLISDRKKISADGQDLAFITVESVDAAGNFQPEGDLPVVFRVSGPGTIAAIASGDLSGTEKYQGRERKLFQGRAQLVVRSGYMAGDIEIVASTKEWEAAERVETVEP